MPRPAKPIFGNLCCQLKAEQGKKLKKLSLKNDQNIAFLQFADNEKCCINKYIDQAMLNYTIVLTNIFGIS